MGKKIATENMGSKEKKRKKALLAGVFSGLERAKKL